MNIPKHVLNCPWVGQQHDILSFCEHLILRLWSIFSQNDNSGMTQIILKTLASKQEDPEQENSRYLHILGPFTRLQICSAI